ncbi:GTP-binding protein [Ruminococcus sp.]|uniref:TIGR03943 family putative permease subunit n=1 Tax=Ruminococcus sp. TaxID=41978 RepID=UPI0025F97B94|nr:GTP-binding protein [Ruminococcus sp.]MBQ9542591.1 GTPase [Ruminococcus sp.]
MMKKIPVYLFLGFLESGKTTLIQKTLANERFGNGENILLLVCEEGLEEYDLSKLKQNNITLHVMEESTELEESSLLKLSDECGADRVVIEYNGMWHLNDLLMNKPESWLIFQTVFAADASTIAMYLQSYRSLVVDKVNICDLAIFYRCTDIEDVNELHSMIRSVNRRADIFYEDADGTMVEDSIEDPLPFDTDDDLILIKDTDYAVWYADIMHRAVKYDGKSVIFKAMIRPIPELPKNVFAVGRYIMTCCEADMQFCRFAALCSRYYPLDKEKWVVITADVIVQHHDAENIDIPFLKMTDLYDCEPPESQIASFS